MTSAITSTCKLFRGLVPYETCLSGPSDLSPIRHIRRHSGTRHRDGTKHRHPHCDSCCAARAHPPSPRATSCPSRAPPPLLVPLHAHVQNKGVQPLLDGVIDYLPAPTEVKNHALDTSEGEKEVELACDPAGPLVALAFKLEETRFGQLTYMRLYSGRLSRGDTVRNMTNGSKLRVPRLVRMHSDDMEEVEAYDLSEAMLDGPVLDLDALIG